MKLILKIYLIFLDKGTQNLELSETDKQINVEGNLKVGGEYATDNAKILEKLPGYTTIVNKTIFLCTKFFKS